ncbi:unnamed protein product, partial [Rotaria socialis]
MQSGIMTCDLWEPPYTVYASN